MYSGQVYIWNYQTQSMVKMFDICDSPVRCAKWIARKNWFVCGSDDYQLRIFNYNTFEKVTTIEAHTDYIRCVAVHPTKSFIISCADDLSIKLWDWDKNWKNTMTFDGHSHYVMMVVFNPKDPNMFASASLDRTIKVWNLGTSTANFTLEGHEKGINCIDYYLGSDKPYIVSGADDKTVKIWDYQNKSCVQTLVAHTHNVSSVCFHPDLPFIVSASEDGTVRLWHASTYRLENTLNYGMERAWSLTYAKGMNILGFGFDEGLVVIKLGREDPSISMDGSGKIIWSKHNEILTANIKTSEDQMKDGERISLPVKDLGTSEIYPQSLQHSPNGRFVVVCGDGEYIIYTALAWRNKSYGSALDFVWAADSNVYAVRENNSKVKIFKSFKEITAIKTPFSAQGIFGGSLLGIRANGFLCFYDWETSTLVRRIDVNSKFVFWSEDSMHVTIASEEEFYILRFNKNVYDSFIEQGNEIPEDGIEDAFEFIVDIPEEVKSGIWVNDCFVYTNSMNRLNYVVGKDISSVSVFDNPLYLLGFVAKEGRVYLSDKDANVTSYSLSMSMIEYQSAILVHDMEKAKELLPLIPNEHVNKVARFLEAQDLKEMALELSSDNDHRFDLAVQLGKLELALSLAEDEEKFKTLAETALSKWNMNLAEKCMWKANDLSGLVLFYVATGSSNGLVKVAEAAEKQNSANIAFTCYSLAHRTDRCLALLLESGREAEAALFARTYCPSQLNSVTNQWKANLAKGHQKIADKIISPQEQPELFAGLKTSLQVENWVKNQHFDSSLPGNKISDYLALSSLNWDKVVASGHWPELLSQSSGSVSFSSKIAVSRYSNDEGSIISDTQSLEVNTTGTGSVLAEELEDVNVEGMNLEDPDDDELNALLNE